MIFLELLKVIAGREYSLGMWMTKLSLEEQKGSAREPILFNAEEEEEEEEG